MSSQYAAALHTNEWPTEGELGPWLNVHLDVCANDQEASVHARSGSGPLHLGFPRCWPAVFKESQQLKDFIKELDGKRCRAVLPPSGDARLYAKLRCSHPMQSFTNARQIVAALDPGWKIVEGWQLFELLDRSPGSTFVAVRHWWLNSPQGVWIDPTPPLVPGASPRKLFVESALGAKTLEPFSEALKISAHAWQQRICRASGSFSTSCLPVHLIASPPSTAPTPPIIRSAVPAIKRHLSPGAPASKAPASLGPVLLGKRVRLAGVSSRPELNGRKGAAVAYCKETERYTVSVGTETLSLPPSCLVAVAAIFCETEVHPRAPRQTVERDSENGVRLVELIADGEVPKILQFQQTRDLKGDGVAHRAAAEAVLRKDEGVHGVAVRNRAREQVLASVDRLLSDSSRCEAYSAALSAALRRGARSVLILGMGSLLPALHAAKEGADVVVVEPSAPLASIVRAAAAQNGVRLAVVAQLSVAKGAWEGPPDVILSEAIDEGLLGGGIVPTVREAISQLHAGGGVPVVIPRLAQVEGVATQLSFEDVRGFALDGLGADLRAFDALRPSGQRAIQPPGYWPVRLLPARQPHRRLSNSFAACSVEFASESASEEEIKLIEVDAIADGLLNAVVFWFSLTVGDGPDTVCSSAPPVQRGRGIPGAWSEGWRQAACYLQTPRYVRKGESLKLLLHRTALGIRFEDASVPPPADLPGDAAATGEDPARTRCLHRPSTAPLARPDAQTSINAYHFCMLADTVRNAAYRRAIEAAVAVRRGCSVLDLGGGSGLLSLVALRAGAGRVDCVEMNPVLARTAQWTLGSSRHPSERDVSLAVWNCVSTDLAIDEGGVAGPSRPADVIVSEVFDTGLIGEGCLHSLRDAARRLLQPGGVMIPAAATIYVMLVQISAPEQADDTSFGALHALRQDYSPLRLHTVNHVKLSGSHAVMRYEFGALADEKGGEAKLTLPALRRGECNAVAWWFDLHLDEQQELSCAPGSPVRTWKQNISYLPTPIPVEAGTEMEVLVVNRSDDCIHVHAGRPGFSDVLERSYCSLSME
ncbi:hypothetical protein AB1Y20_002014 [Prymnesium parvum]|uniref:Protein arginine N-methyltransferase domain-containing protein n=1 Tax=Prymnesium parvum TaxID=97485 RepID=A0AB34J9Y7_PRYPA